MWLKYTNKKKYDPKNVAAHPNINIINNLIVTISPIFNIVLNGLIFSVKWTLTLLNKNNS